MNIFVFNFMWNNKNKMSNILSDSYHGSRLCCRHQGDLDDKVKGAFSKGYWSIWVVSTQDHHVVTKCRMYVQKWADWGSHSPGHCHRRGEHCHRGGEYLLVTEGQVIAHQVETWDGNLKVVIEKSVSVWLCQPDLRYGLWIQIPSLT